jgi:hypothetical protein
VNNQGPELSPEARRLINEARGADDPTAEDHARVKARWLASVAAVAGVSSLTEAARAAGGIGWGFKAAGAALVIAAGAIGLNFALDGSVSTDANAPAPLPGWSGNAPERFQKTPHSRPESEKAAQAASGYGSGAGAATIDPAHVVVSGAAPTAVPAQPDAPQPDAPQPGAAQPAAGALPLIAGSEPSAVTPADAVGAAPDVPAPQAAMPQAAFDPAAVPQAALPQTAVRARPVSRAAVARAAAPKAAAKEAASPAPEPVEAAPAAAGPSGQLSDELALLSDVRSSIQEGAAARALELLNRYESRFCQPILGMEADALRVDALCKAGQREAARESARAFQNEWPGSPLERRVSAACP